MNKNLKGGNNKDHYVQIQSFLSMVILGYFGVKIVYGIFFKFYPNKYYYRNIEINTSEGENYNNEDDKKTFKKIEDSDRDITKKIVLNAYMPGIWNTEITDFVVTVILSLIIFIYTNMANRTMIDSNGNLHKSLLFGYFIGLGYPPFSESMSKLIKVDDNNNYVRSFINCMTVGLFIISILFIVFLNYYFVNNNFENTLSYTTFIATIILLLFGLFISRKTQDTISSVSYNYSNKANCSMKSNKYLMSSGDVVKISPIFATFVLLLLFSYDPTHLSWSYIYIFFYGILLGTFVSGISYFGIEYFLIKEPIRHCDTYSECQDSYDSNDDSGNSKDSDDYEREKYDNYTVRIIKLLMIISIFIIISFLLYNKMGKNN